MYVLPAEDEPVVEMDFQLDVVALRLSREQPASLLASRSANAVLLRAAAGAITTLLGFTHMLALASSVQ